LTLGRAIFDIRSSDISEFVEDAGRADSISQKSQKTSLSSATARLDFWKPGTTFVLPRQLRFCRTDAALAASAALLLVPLHRDCGDLSKLSHAKSGKHYRSDPVRVQSTPIVDMTRNRLEISWCRPHRTDFWQLVAVARTPAASARNFAASDTNSTLFTFTGLGSAMSCSSERDRAA
jgi:hypothetical protein